MAKPISARLAGVCSAFLGNRSGGNPGSRRVVRLDDGLCRASHGILLARVHDQRLRRFPLRRERAGFCSLCLVAGDSNGALCAAGARRRVRPAPNFPGAFLGAVGVFVPAAVSLARRQFAGGILMVCSKRRSGRSLWREFRRRVEQCGDLSCLARSRGAGMAPLFAGGIRRHGRPGFACLRRGTASERR